MLSWFTVNSGLVSLTKRGIAHRQQVLIPVVYDGIAFEGGFRADFIIEEILLAELKCVETFAPAHKAQVLTYLRFTGLRQGLLLNFNAARMKDGIRSILNTGEVARVRDEDFAAVEGFSI